jgi:hypothetical protein
MGAARGGTSSDDTADGSSTNTPAASGAGSPDAPANVIRFALGHAPRLQRNLDSFARAVSRSDSDVGPELQPERRAPLRARHGDIGTRDGRHLGLAAEQGVLSGDSYHCARNGARPSVAARSIGGHADGLPGPIRAAHALLHHRAPHLVGPLGPRAARGAAHRILPRLRLRSPSHAPPLSRVRCHVNNK